jgi:hypothetical protein
MLMNGVRRLFNEWLWLINPSFTLWIFRAVCLQDYYNEHYWNFCNIQLVSCSGAWGSQFNTFYGRGTLLEAFHDTYVTVNGLIRHNIWMARSRNCSIGDMVIGLRVWVSQRWSGGWGNDNCNAMLLWWIVPVWSCFLQISVPPSMPPPLEDVLGDIKMSVHVCHAGVMNPSVTVHLTAGI